MKNLPYTKKGNSHFLTADVCVLRENTFAQSAALNITHTDKTPAVCEGL